MKFFIDNVEIKTVTEGAAIKGALNSITRNAAFSFVVSEDIKGSLDYLVVVGSVVLIKNDNNEDIFRGSIVRIDYSEERHLMSVEAQDELAFLATKFFKGRLKGFALDIIHKIAGADKLYKTIQDFFKKEINLVIIEDKISVYDVLKILFRKLFKDEFKIYMDGIGKIHILLPFVDNISGDFYIGQDVLQANFSSDLDKNISKITAKNRDEIVSGSVIRLIDPRKEIYGEFIVEQDIHTYSNVSTMQLMLKERRMT